MRAAARRDDDIDESPMSSEGFMKMSVRRFATNAGWNVIGQVAPLAVGVIVLPTLIKAMGIDRYGFLTLVWVLVGYAGLFDFGIGRALTRTVAYRLGNQDKEGARHAAMVGMTYLFGFGLLVGAIFAAMSPWLVHGVFGIPESMRAEALRALLLLATSIPVVMLSAGYSGILSAYQQFGAMNMVKACLGIATYLGPLAVVTYHNRLEYIVAFIVIMRFISNRALAVMCHRQCDVRFWPVWPDRPTSKELFSLGGWISISNIVSPILTYLDRLILGGLVAVHAVAYYATPYDMVIKSLIVPYSIMGAIFPVAAGMAIGGEDNLRLFKGSVKILLCIMFPLELTVFVVAYPVLELWLGSDFATNGAPVLQWLSVGLLFNSLAQVPATMIQAAGRPKWMALLHVVELPIFVFMLWALTTKFGIAGTAMAATCRYVIDTAVIYGFALFGVFGRSPNYRSLLAPAAVVAVLFIGAFWVPHTVGASLLYLVPALACFALYAWRALLTISERERTLVLFDRLRGRRA